jgi:calcineurin-like phosphoesterase family protein
MKIYLITDTHFCHEKMVEYCNRPGNFDYLIWQGLKKLPKDSLLIHLGDICIGNDLLVHLDLQRLPFKKILVKGNHDKKSNSWYLKNGWDFVCDKFEDTYFGKKIVFSHVPAADDGEFDINIHGHFHNTLHRLLQGKYVVDGEKERNERDLMVLTPKHKLLAIEYTDYKPILLDNFLSL